MGNDIQFKTMNMCTNLSQWGQAELEDRSPAGLLIKTILHLATSF